MALMYWCNFTPRLPYVICTPNMILLRVHGVLNIFGQYFASIGIVFQRRYQNNSLILQPFLSFSLKTTKNTYYSSLLIYRPQKIASQKAMHKNFVPKRQNCLVCFCSTHWALLPICQYEEKKILPEIKKRFMLLNLSKSLVCYYFAITLPSGHYIVQKYPHLLATTLFSNM